MEYAVTFERLEGQAGTPLRRRPAGAISIKG